jgi:hypothetical protein
MLFNSGLKERLKRRLADLGSEPEYLEMLLRTFRVALADSAGLAGDDIRPGLHSLDIVIAALRIVTNPDAEAALQDMEETRRRYFLQSASFKHQVLSWIGAALLWMAER